MATTFVSRRIVAAAAGLVLTAVIFAGAQQPQLAGKTAEQAFKNMQVLKEIPAEQVVPTMRVMAGSLGVNCGFCHVEDRSKDDLMTKQDGTQNDHHDDGDQQEQFRRAPGSHLLHLPQGHQ